jgi:hypothetical protein
MSNYNFITKDPETILSDIIALFQSKAGTTLNDADPERILIDIMAYREVLTKNQMEWLMHQNFVQLAEGLLLDYWGALFGVTRITNETDDAYRARILAANKAVGVGTKAAYKSQILSLTNVADVLLYSKNDDPTLLPGRVRIVPIMKVVDVGTQIAYGEVHDTALEIAVLTAILTDEFGVVGNVFHFSEATPVPIDGTVSVRRAIGFDAATFAANLEFQIARYFGQLSLSYTAEFGIVALTSYLSNAEGLGQVLSLTFDVDALAEGEFYQRGAITVNIE